VADATAHHFILGLLDRAGWGPDFTRCGICGESVVAACRPILDSRGSGVICARHEAERRGMDAADPGYQPTRRVISAQLLDYLRRAHDAIAADAASRVRADATQLLDRLIDLHTAKPFKSRRFLAEIRGDERYQRG
jgi:recombinational DNA repair protein (RecF pathway)